MHTANEMIINSQILLYFYKGPQTTQLPFNMDIQTIMHENTQNSRTNWKENWYNKSAY